MNNAQLRNIKGAVRDLLNSTDCLRVFRSGSLFESGRRSQYFSHQKVQFVDFAFEDGWDCGHMLAMNGNNLVEIFLANPRREDFVMVPGKIVRDLFSHELFSGFDPDHVWVWVRIVDRFDGFDSEGQPTFRQRHPSDIPEEVRNILIREIPGYFCQSWGSFSPSEIEEEDKLTIE